MYKFQKDIPNFAHPILEQVTVFTNVNTPDMWAPARCDTPRGNTTCTCGKYNMLWIVAGEKLHLYVHDAMTNAIPHEQCAVIHVARDDWMLTDETAFETFVNMQWKRFIGQPDEPERVINYNALWEDYNRIASAVFEAYAQAQQQSQRVNEHFTHDCPVCSENCTCREFYTERFCNHTC